MPASLQLQGVSVSYGGLKAVEDVSLALERGGVLGIAGPNGAGKTSLLRGILGLAPLCAGAIRYEEEVIADAARAQRANVRHCVQKGICLVPEGRKLFSGLSVEDHLKFGAYLVGSKSVAEDMARVTAIFPKLQERRKQDVSTLSGGEKQMVAIGRGLMARPKLLMIDELSLGLAPVVVMELIKALKDLNAATGITLILVDEGLTRLRSIVSRVIFMSHGHVRATLTKEELGSDSANLYLHQQD